MKEKKLFDAITHVEDKLVEEAKNTKLKRGWRVWQKWTAAAACMVLIIGAAFAIPHDASKLGGIISNYSNKPCEAILDVVFPKAYGMDDYDTWRETIDNNPVDHTFLEGVEDFSYKTASKILTGSTENTNYSPLSLYYALALAASGTNGETEAELLSLLGVADKSTLSTQCGNLYRRLYTDNEIGKLKIANSLWMNKEIKWKDGFIKNAADNFYASSFSADFSDHKTGEAMAKWVSDNTNGKLTPSMAVTPEQIFSIINTVYFYDEWTDTFSEKHTAKDVFHLADGTDVNCDFMNNTCSMSSSTKGDGFTRASLGLKNNGRMVFILPDEGISLRELLSTPEQMKTIFEAGEENSAKVIWQIPKFSFGSKLDIVETLKSLGVNSAFSSNADFSGITNQTAFINKIHQETYIGINEKGVEAAAYTEIAYAGGMEPETETKMILNRPFIYGITDSYGTLLFTGVCENPAAK